MRVEATMRDDLYDNLQRLPVSFHDRWPAGQLMSRAVSDLSTIRRFLAFGLVFLIVNIATFVVGVGILLCARPGHLGLVVAALAIPLVAAVVRLRVALPGARPPLAGPGRATSPPWSRSRSSASASSRRSAAARTCGGSSCAEARDLRAHRARQGAGDLRALGGDHRAARDRAGHRAAPRHPRGRGRHTDRRRAGRRSSAWRWACAGRSTPSAGCWRSPTTPRRPPSGSSR